jgi:hypothetical protein
MVDAPGSIALSPLKEPVIDIFYVDGGCSRISVSTRQGATIDIALMVGVFRSITPAPLRGMPSMFLSVDGGHPWIYSSDTS